MPRRRRPPRPGALAELPPLRILSQILMLQALYYLGALVLLGFTALVSGTAFGLDLVLGWEAVRGDTTQGWLLAFVWVLNGGITLALAIIVFISRSKLAPDFALTTHALHLVVVTLYSGTVPHNGFWWLALAASSGASVSLGIWGCRYRELQPITFFGGGGGSRGAGARSGGGSRSGDTLARTGGGSTTAADPERGLPPDEDDAEVSLSRGRGRGRGRDESGGYEMVGMGDFDDGSRR